MAMTKKMVRDELREKWVGIVSESIEQIGEDVLHVKSNEIAIPVVDSTNEEQYIVITIKVPTGSRDGEPYDGYTEAEFYKEKVAEKKAKAEANAKKKAEKIAKSKAKKKAK